MKKAIKLIIIATILLLVFLGMTNPNNLPTAALLVPFLGMFLVLTAVFSVLFSWSKGEIGPKTVRAAAITASLPVLLLVLRSMGQLTIRDVFMLGALFAVVYFYMARSRAIAKS